MSGLKKQIPNCITSLRIIGAILLLFLDPHGSAFLIVYTLCGVTDALDGAAARMLGAASPFGAKLDSVSDMVFYAAMLIRVLPVIWSELSPFTLILAGLAILLRISSYVTAAIRFRVFSSLHTYLSKLTGLLVFLLPYLIFLFRLPENAVSLCAAASGTLASLEDLLINLTSPVYQNKRQSIFCKPAGE